jgi:hypothetical protein
VDADVVDARPAGLGITPAAFDFHEVLSCDDGAEATFTVANTGEAAASPPRLKVSDGYLLVHDNCSGLPSLAGGALCTVGVVPHHPAVGTHRGMLSASIPTATASAALTVDGIGQGGDLMVAPAAFDFGAVVIGASSPPLSIFLSAGDASPPVGSVTLVGSSDFTVSGGCGDHIPACGRCEYTVVFTPSALGPRAVSVMFSFGGGFTVSLSGTGVAPPPVTSPALDAGSAPLTPTGGTPSATRSSPGAI